MYSFAICYRAIKKKEEKNERRNKQAFEILDNLTKLHRTFIREECSVGRIFQLKNSLLSFILLTFYFAFTKNIKIDLSV